jgi:hypothetical protein
MVILQVCPIVQLGTLQFYYKFDLFTEGIYDKESLLFLSTDNIYESVFKNQCTLSKAGSDVHVHV